MENTYDQYTNHRVSPLIQLPSKFHDNRLIRQRKLISGKDVSWLDGILNNNQKKIILIYKRLLEKDTLLIKTCLY